MLCIWWDWKGTVYYELLPHNQTINSDKYCSQLDRLKATIDEKRPELTNRKGVVFHRDNVRSHVSLHTRQKLQLGWDVLPHSSYSPDLAPPDYIYSGLYRISLMERTSILWKPVKITWSSSSPRKMSNSENGIMKLPQRWRKVMEQNGTYVNKPMYKYLTIVNEFRLKTATNFCFNPILFFRTKQKWSASKRGGSQTQIRLRKSMVKYRPGYL